TDRGRLAAAEEGGALLDPRELLLDGAGAEQMLVLAMDQRGEPEAPRSRNHEDAAVGMQIGPQNVRDALGSVHVNDEEAVVIGSAGQVDPEPRTDDGGGAVGADYHAGANALLGAAVAAEDRTAYALSLFHEPQQPSAIVDLDSPGRSRCLDKYSLDSGMRENEVRITHIGQGERHVQHEAGPVVEELHPADRARAGGATPVERAPASQERGHR